MCVFVAQKPVANHAKSGTQASMDPPPDRRCAECLARKGKLLCADEAQSYASVLINLPLSVTGKRKHFLAMASSVQTSGVSTYCSEGCNAMTFLLHEDTAMSKAWPSTHMADHQRSTEIKNAIVCARRENTGSKPKRREDRVKKHKSRPEVAA